MYQLILASASPRRKEILEAMGISYRVVTSKAEEVTGETVPARMVQDLAGLKAREVAKEVKKAGDKRESIILGADTMVFYREHALGKPKDIEDAVRMLELLSGDVHEVYTGVSIVIIDKEGREEVLSFAVSTKVAFYPLTKAQIMDYIATGEPMDKAGAYAIQGSFGIYIKEITGDYYNVVGLPIAKINQMLLDKGIDIKKLK
jgi:septum formation protein